MPSDERGLTLVEILIALVVISVGLVGHRHRRSGLERSDPAGWPSSPRAMFPGRADARGRPRLATWDLRPPRVDCPRRLGGRGSARADRRRDVMAPPSPGFPTRRRSGAIPAYRRILRVRGLQRDAVRWASPMPPLAAGDGGFVTYRTPGVAGSADDRQGRHARMAGHPEVIRRESGAEGCPRARAAPGAGGARKTLVATVKKHLYY